MDNPNTLVLDVSFACPLPGPYRGNEFATMHGPFSPLGPLSGNEGDGSYGVFGTWFQVDPCKLSGGSDLPGAVLIYKTVISGPGPNQGLSAVNYWTLPRELGGPVLTAGSTPPHGTRVHPGEVIKIHITATEANGGPEPGIQEIALGLSPLLTIDKATYGDHPTACDKSRLTKTLTTTYTVPADPPPIVHLTAIAHDFAGNESSTLSADFPTGDEWEGTSTSHLDTSGCTSTVIETIDFVVAGNGAVSGTSHGTANIADSCGTYHPFPLGPYTLSGRLQHNAFTFPFLLSMPGYGRPVSIPLVSTKSASAQFTWTPPGGRPATSNVTLTCITC
jgi:hypothetical protein